MIQSENHPSSQKAALPAQLRGLKEKMAELVEARRRKVDFHEELTAKQDLPVARMIAEGVRGRLRY